MKHFRLNTWADKTSVNAIFAGVKGLNFKQIKKKKIMVLEINLDVVSLKINLVHSLLVSYV